MRKRIEIEIPEGVEKYVVLKDDKVVKLRNAMILYSYIYDEIISYGKAAELLGISKMELITLYGSVGISYFDESDEELQEDMKNIVDLSKKD